MEYQVKKQNMDPLNECITAGCARITPRMLKRVRPERDRRIRMCYQHNGTHTKHDIRK
jgi:hypothetical protein